MVKGLSTKTLIVSVLVLFALILLFKSGSGMESYATVPQGAPLPGMDPSVTADADADYAPVNFNSSVMPSCILEKGAGLSSSLLPREMPSMDQFGQFAPDDILKSQNFLDPRNQIGFPESVAGSLRNANHQLRADPPIPKIQFPWMNSTIVPDLMQRNLA